MMTQPVSISLIMQPISQNSRPRPLAKARLAVFETLLKDEIRIKEWSLECFEDTSEFWITPEAIERIVFRFGDRAVFKVPDIETWEWFLNQKDPNATIRSSEYRTLDDMYRSREISKQDFKLSMLQSLFHDMKYWKSPSICRKAAKWLVLLNDPILKPFKFIQDRRLWEDWDLAGSHSRFRRTRVKILFDNDNQSNIIKQDSLYFWEKVCLQYQKWAQTAMPDTQYHNYCQRLAEELEKW